MYFDCQQLKQKHTHTRTMKMNAENSCGVSSANYLALFQKEGEKTLLRIPSSFFYFSVVSKRHTKEEYLVESPKYARKWKRSV